jgi:hypothetical protein
MKATPNRFGTYAAGRGRRVIVIGNYQHIGFGRTLAGAIRAASNPRRYVAWDCLKETRVKNDGSLSLNFDECPAAKGMTEDQCFKLIEKQ